MKRQISYVLQDDIFFPNLTLRETLKVVYRFCKKKIVSDTNKTQYSALLRLPHEQSFHDKIIKVEDIIATLRLEDCANTSRFLCVY